MSFTTVAIFLPALAFEQGSLQQDAPAALGRGLIR